jgi:hypothetical protein
MKWLFLIFSFYIFACNSSRSPGMQIFSPIAIDITKFDQQDYSEIISLVNKVSGSEPSTYNQVSILSNESTFSYIRVNSSIDESCYRVSIDRHRSSIVNIQPDCAITEE